MIQSVNDCPPIAVAWPLAPASNENGEITLRDATVSQLLHAIARKFLGMPAERRQLMGALAMSVLTYIVSREVRQ